MLNNLSNKGMKSNDLCSSYSCYSIVKDNYLIFSSSNSVISLTV